jgi:hypothetical protein
VGVATKPAAGTPAAGPETPTGVRAPLSAAFCAERAAAAITRAEAFGNSGDDYRSRLMLAAATAWRDLGCAMATNSAMNRPRDPDDRR